MNGIPNNNLISALAQLRQPGPVVATRPPASRVEAPAEPPKDITPPADSQAGQAPRRASPLGQRVDIRV